MCKCAIPVVKIKEIMKKLQEKGISFAIYDYAPKGIDENSMEKYKEIARYISFPISENREHFECNRCQFHNLYRNNAQKHQHKIKQVINDLERREYE